MVFWKATGPVITKMVFPLEVGTVVLKSLKSLWKMANLYSTDSAGYSPVYLLQVGLEVIVKIFKLNTVSEIP